MKRTLISGMFITAALLASPAFAADDLCDANLQALKDAQVSTNTNMSGPMKMNLEKTEKEAMAAKHAGDEKKCIEITAKTISELKTKGSGTDSAK
jgi:hypothetical protein